MSRQALDVVDPDGRRHHLVADDDGNVRLDGISVGVCDVTLRALDGRDWSIDGGGDDGELRPDQPSHDHVATAGDCLSSLARRKGFRRLRPLISANAELLAKRQNPNVLAEGDRLVVPERLLRVEPCATGRVHVATVVTVRVLLRVKLQACEAATPWRLVVAGSTVSRGLLVAEQDETLLIGEVPASAPRAELELDERPPRRLVLLLGRMAPWDVEQGWRARLHNLGYIASPGAELGALRRGVALFQRDHGLAVDGDAGPRTLATLRQVHGC